MAKTARIDAVAFAGRSGRTYDLRVYVWDTKFKSLPGVYVVASRSIEPGEPPTYQAVFVGAAEDLSKALKNHPHDECFQMYYANVVGVLKEPDPAQREQIAADLIEGLGPPCNSPDALL